MLPINNEPKLINKFWSNKDLPNFQIQLETLYNLISITTIPRMNNEFYEWRNWTKFRHGIDLEWKKTGWSGQPKCDGSGWAGTKPKLHIKLIKLNVCGIYIKIFYWIVAICLTDCNFKVC